MHTLKVFLKLCDLNIKKLFVYRTSFFISLLLMGMWVFSYTILIEVIFYHTQTLAGWHKGEVLVIMSFYYFVQNTSDVFFKDNIENFGDTLRRGELDFRLVKPASSRLLSFFWEIRFDHLASFIPTIFLFIHGARSLETSISTTSFIAGALLLLVSTVLYFSILSFIAILTFWVEKNETFNILIFNVSQLARYPRQIYQAYLGKLLTFGLPLALIASIPAEVALSFNNGWLPIFLIIITGVFYGLSSIFWHYGLRRYSSAN